MGASTDRVRTKRVCSHCGTTPQPDRRPLAAARNSLESVLSTSWDLNVLFDTPPILLCQGPLESFITLRRCAEAHKQLPFEELNLSHFSQIEPAYDAVQAPSKQPTRFTACSTAHTNTSLRPFLSRPRLT